jgi:hypothetical protein
MIIVFFILFVLITQEQTRYSSGIRVKPFTGKGRQAPAPPKSFRSKEQ